MTESRAHRRGSGRAAKPAIAAAVALASSLAFAAGSAPVRLVGVSTQGNAILIESSEPVAYVVKRPDALTVLVELRNVSVSTAANSVERRDPIRGVSLEQGSADGQTVGRVRVSLARPLEYTAHSARNTIRVELNPPVARTASAPFPGPTPAPALDSRPGTAAAAAVEQDIQPATLLEKVRAIRTIASTTVTLTGNGRLTPADVSESDTAPRRLILDFPNVMPETPAQTSVDGPLVKRVRVGVNSREPLVTRVVMEVADGATYHVERAGERGTDLAVVFEPPQSTTAVLLAPARDAAAKDDPEPDIPLDQAIANAAALTPKDAPPDKDAVVALVARKDTPPSAKDPVAAVPPAKDAPPAKDPLATLKAPVTPRPVPVARQQPAPPPPPVVPPPAPSPSTTRIITSTGEKQYRGNPITLDFSGADLRSVLRYFNEISGLNIIIDPSVPATPIDVVLKDVPWDQAFETLLRTHKLGYTAEGTILRIAPLSVLAEEEGDRRKLAEAKALAGDLRVQTFSLSYAKAGDVSPLLVKSALSQRGQIQVDARTNTIIVTDLPDRLQTVTALLGALDRPEPQVEVEARVVQTTREFAKAMGIQWGLNGRATPGIGNTTGLAFPNSGTVGGRTGATNAPNDNRATANDTTGTVVNLPVAGATSAIGLALGSINGALNLDVALSALERTGKGRILSTPRLTTQNNVAAEVTQGLQIPIQTVANNTVTVSFKDAALTLQVTPQITSANTVIMQITLENATPDFSRQVNGIPPIDTQRARTQVQVDDGATTIIGGIFVSREQISNERTPLLHRVPLLGWLFRRDTTSDESRELLIFITPRIIKG
jgi:type IV pilus secretin PilQ/predicted competence protein